MFVIDNAYFLVRNYTLEINFISSHVSFIRIHLYFTGNSIICWKKLHILVAIPSVFIFYGQHKPYTSIPKKFYRQQIKFSFKFQILGQNTIQLHARQYTTSWKAFFSFNDFSMHIKTVLHVPSSQYLSMFKFNETQTKKNLTRCCHIFRIFICFKLEYMFFTKAVQVKTCERFFFIGKMFFSFFKGEKKECFLSSRKSTLTRKYLFSYRI